MDMRFRDVQILVELARTRSVRELARRLGTTAGQISKTVKMVEHRLGLHLLNRSAYGVEFTAEGLDVLARLEHVHDLHVRLRGEIKTTNEGELLRFASTSYFSTHLLPLIATKLQAHGTRLRLLDLPPSQFVAAGLRDAFHYCVHTKALDWPKTWVSIEIGHITWNLYCRSSHPLPETPTLERVLKEPFIYPVYWSDEGLRFGDDGFPRSRFISAGAVTRPQRPSPPPSLRCTRIRWPSSRT